MVTLHSQITIGYLEQAVKEGRTSWLFFADGHMATIQEARDYLDGLKAQGFKYIPCDCQPGAPGECPGFIKGFGQQAES